jgi:hypothetical protein
MLRTEIDLHGLESLKPGWNGYSAPPPDHKAIEAARRYLQIASEENLEPQRVEPSVMGGVGITHRKEAKKVYVEFYNDGTIHSLFSERAANMQTLPVNSDPEQLRRLLVKARGYLDRM